MSTADYIGFFVFGCIVVLSIIVNVRIHRAARMGIEKFLCQEGWRSERIERRWLKVGPFDYIIHRNKSVFRAMVTDAASHTFTVWFQFQHDLSGNIRETETKFEHANRHC